MYRLQITNYLTNQIDHKPITRNSQPVIPLTADF